MLDTIGLTAPNLKYLQPLLLLRNNKGSFVRVPPEAAGPAFHSGRPSRGAAFGDLDNDGYTDVIVRHLTNDHAKVLGSLARLAEVRRALR